MDSKMSLLRGGCRLTRLAQCLPSQCRRAFRQHPWHVGARGAGATTTMVPHRGCPWAGHPLQQPLPLPRAPVGWLSQGDWHGARWGPSATTGGCCSACPSDPGLATRDRVASEMGAPVQHDRLSSTGSQGLLSQQELVTG